jgi:hypothetical protein
MDAASANKKAAAQLLREQVKALRQEERSVEKNIKARFQAIIHADQLGEKELRQERAALHQQEEAALALTSDKSQRDAIRAQYEGLRGNLKGGVKLDQAAIRQLHDQERATVKQLKDLYNARIKALELQIRALH